ncbi:Fmp52 protein [Martiniozyma asiatica (nom. inval.)]|nr:Fmp52 protein [Martiniozyma asiatica]
MAVFIIGATGLVGSHFLSQLLSGSEKVLTLTRRLPSVFQNSTPSHIETIINTDTKQWDQSIIESSKDVPEGSIFFSAFGTTKANAGSMEKFKEIDYGVNYSSFKAAKECGKYDTAILISSIGANPDSIFGYLQSKGELEKDVEALGFKKTLILRPGVLLGEREKPKGWNNRLAEKVGRWVKNTPFDIVASYPIDGEEVAKCTKVLIDNGIKDGVTIIESKEMRDIAIKGSL